MPGKLISIQALRAVAALAVTFAHAANYTGDTAGRLAIVNPVPGMVTGAAGVDLFFVISGFIMVITTAGQSGPMAAGQFIKRRLIRIVPLYWIATITFLLYATYGVGAPWAQNGIDWPSVFYSLGFVFHLRPNGSWEPILGPGWSLNYEMFFYVMFTAMLLLPRAAALLLLVVGFGFLGGWRHLLPFQFPDALGMVVNHFLWEFAFGAVIGVAFNAGLRLPGWLCAVLAIVGTALFVQTALAATPWHPNRSIHWGAAGAMMVAGCALLRRNPEGQVWRAASLIGDASYALYLFHGIVILFALYHLTPLTQAVMRWLGPWPFLFYLVGLATGASVLIYLVVERPLTEALRGVIARRRPAPEPLPAT